MKSTSSSCIKGASNNDITDATKSFIFVKISLLSLILFTGCSKRQQKHKTEMNFDELKNGVSTMLKNEKHQYASELLEEIITKHPERPDIHRFKIILADVYFKLQQYQSAYKLYKNYVQQYPSHGKAEYAQYQAVLSKFYQTLRVDCDQTVTSDTIALCDEYTSNQLYKKYLKDVADIKTTCEHKIVNKEIYVFNFYLNQGKFDAAKSRLNHLKTAFLPKQKNLAARLYYLECKLAKKMHDDVTVKTVVAQLDKEFPDTHFTRMAKDIANRPSFVF